MRFILAHDSVRQERQRPFCACSAELLACQNLRDWHQVPLEDRKNTPQLFAS